MNKAMEETFDYKRFFAVNQKRIGIVIIAAFIGAAVFAIVYCMIKLVFAGPTIYRTDALYSIEFEKETFNDVIIYYNDYTWNDVIDSDRIAGAAAKELGMDENYLYEMTNVPTMSDMRLIHLYVDSKNPDEAVTVQEAINQKLVLFGETTPGFISISQWSVSDSYPLEEDFLIGRVSLAGLLIGMAFGILLMMYYSAIDDSIYTEKDASYYTGLPCAGIVTNDISKEQKIKLTNTIEALLGNEIQIFLTDANNSEKQKEEFLKAISDSSVKVTDISNLEDKNIYEEAKGKSNILIVVTSGMHNGNRLNGEIARLNAIGMVKAAVVVTNGDKAILKRYYGE